MKKKLILATTLFALMGLNSACVKRSPQGADRSTAQSSAAPEDDFNIDESNSGSSDAKQDVAIDTMDKQSNLLPQVSLTSDTKEYVVKENETLMLVAYNIYGNYKKWHSIYKLNKDVLKSSRAKLTAGTVLKYYAPKEEFNPIGNGEPYLILEKDTLGLVSKKVYQSRKRWKEIWKNNAYIIDPNVIFAGFTLYYVKDDKLAQK